MRTKMFNPVVNYVSFQQLAPVLPPRYVARQVLDAIEWNRDEIILPYHLKYAGFIMDYILPQRLSRWLTYQVSGRTPLDPFNRDSDESVREKKRKLLNINHKENIDLI